jgi:hypothetical protein
MLDVAERSKGNNGTCWDVYATPLGVIAILECYKLPPRPGPRKSASSGRYGKPGVVTLRVTVFGYEAIDGGGGIIDDDNGHL